MNQKTKSEYKSVKSLFGQYEEIPEEWDLKPISEILEITMGQSPPVESYNQQQEGLPFYQGVKDFGYLVPSPTIWCTEPKKIAKENSILFAVRAPVGELNLTKSKCCLGRGVAALNPLEGDLLYCYYLVLYNKNRFLVYSQGSTFEAINHNEIKKVKLPYTKDIKEQKKIASILSGVDALIESTQEVIESTTQLKKGLTQRLLTKGIGHKKFKKMKSLFGKYKEIPEEWKVFHLTDPTILKISSGESIKNIQNKGTYPVYGSNGVMGFIDKHNETNAILIGRVGSAGSVNLLDQKAWVTDNVLVLKLDSKLYKKFIYYVLVYLNLNRLTARAVQPLLTQSILRSVQIMLPSFSEQKRIASILAEVDASEYLIYACIK